MSILDKIKMWEQKKQPQTQSVPVPKLPKKTEGPAKPPQAQQQQKSEPGLKDTVAKNKGESSQQNEARPGSINVQKMKSQFEKNLSQPMGVKLPDFLTKPEVERSSKNSTDAPKVEQNKTSFEKKPSEKRADLEGETDTASRKTFEQKRLLAEKMMMRNQERASQKKIEEKAKEEGQNQKLQVQESFKEKENGEIRLEEDKEAADRANMISDYIFDKEINKKDSLEDNEKVNSGGYQMEAVTLETRKKSNKRRKNNDEDFDDM